MTRFLIAMVLGGVGLGCNTTVTTDDFGGAGSLGLFDDLIPDRDEYVFPEVCPATDDLDLCGECCSTQGFDMAAVYGTDCGCQNSETNDTLCAASADADACASCCEQGGYPTYFYLSDDTSPLCSCMRPSKEPHPVR